MDLALFLGPQPLNFLFHWHMKWRVLTTRYCDQKAGYHYEWQHHHKPWSKVHSGLLKLLIVWHSVTVVSKVTIMPCHSLPTVPDTSMDTVSVCKWIESVTQDLFLIRQCSWNTRSSSKLQCTEKSQGPAPNSEFRSSRGGHCHCRVLSFCWSSQGMLWSRANGLSVLAPWTKAQDTKQLGLHHISSKRPAASGDRSNYVMHTWSPWALTYTFRW